MPVVTSNVGLSTTALVANQVSLMASYREKLIAQVCACLAANALPITIVYSYGTPVLSGTTLFVPITAQITVNTGSNNPPQFTETFDVAFQGQTSLPTATNPITIASVGRISHSQGNCLLINDSLTIAITPAG